MIVNLSAIAAAAGDFKGAVPFDHIVVDNFFTEDIAKALEAEFPAADAEVWHSYQNAIEVKRVCNNWNLFPQTTYQVFAYLNSAAFTAWLGEALGLDNLSADPGLNGGGWHVHGRGGKLNTHLDYSIHPKLGRQRKLNIIIYINSGWQAEWGGQLGLWHHDRDTRGPGALAGTVEPVFNRAVIFDTTQDSWHGLPSPLTCPEDQARQSLAVYYLCPAPEQADPRGKALFAPTAEQAGDKDVLDLIRLRADASTAGSVYRG